MEEIIWVKQIKEKNWEQEFIREQMALTKRDILIALENREVYMLKQLQRWEKQREKIFENEKQINVIDTKMTLDEWYEKWITVCKKHCRTTTKRTYEIQYNRLRESLGWRKLTSLNLIVLQDAFNELGSDKSRSDCKALLVDILNRAVEADLLIKNPEQFFEHLTPHGLRHTFATNCIKNGMEPKTLQKILGHNSLQMTMDLYCHVRESTLTDELERIANFI